ncbi:MAG: ATP--guanido phosphotransferase [Phycisphaerales bacterium]
MSEAGSVFSSEQVASGASWLSAAAGESDVVVSSRIRLARNLVGFPFPKKGSRVQRQQVMDLIRARVQRLARTSAPDDRARLAWIDVHQSVQADRMLMVERHVISKEHAQGDLPRAVAISLPDERVSIMVNEEDQIRLQVMCAGLQLGVAFEQADRLDSLLGGLRPAPEQGASAERSGPRWIPDETDDWLRYAYSPRFGYLTACPTNVGTGMRVSVMLHLPALRLTGEIDKVRRATKDMNLAVRGYYGEGSEAAGDLFQISNQTTLGKPERVLLHEFEREVLPHIVEYERKARTFMVTKRRKQTEDTVFRALGTLRYARRLTPEEALPLLSQVRLGILTGLIDDVKVNTVNQLVLLTQPQHLQRLVGKEMDQDKRREARADLVRDWVKPT